MPSLHSMNLTLASRASVQTHLHRRDFRRSRNPCLLVGRASPNPLEHPLEDGSVPVVLYKPMSTSERAVYVCI